MCRWAPGLLYGLGLMDVSHWAGLHMGEAIGHGGETYGFSAWTGHLPHLGLSISVGSNMEEVATAKYVAGVVTRILKEHRADYK